MQNILLKVQGMSCGHCVNSIEDAVRKLGAAAKVDLQSKQVEVTYDESKLALEAIKETIEDQGYEVV